jgi:ABC-type branched-subunit amino acid transport system substrate-binding protein
LSKPANKVLNLLIFSALVTSMYACSGAARSSRKAHIPSSPATQSSYEALQQGLKYVREHPPANEEDQVQRFLWLDQWLDVLEKNRRLSKEDAKIYWQDLDAFITQPPISERSINQILDRVQTIFGRNVALYHKYEMKRHKKEQSEGVRGLEEVQEDGITDIYDRSQELIKLNRMDTSDVSSRKIGVLLPLSGKLSGFAKDVVYSIQLAANLSYSDGVEFVIEDIGTNEAQLIKAWERLVFNEKVVAVLGPLTTKESEIIFERAGLLSVPVISLAPKEDLDLFGSYAFQSTLTIADQLESLADFIRSDLRAKKVAIVSPDSSYGWDVVERAIHKFQRKGLKIMEMQVYPSRATDFKGPLSRITRLDFPKLRKFELCPKEEETPEEEAAAEELKPEVSAEIVEEVKKEEPKNCVEKLTELQPVLDFEVLFVPDFANTIGLLLPTLPYLRMYGVQVVGLSGLHSKTLLQRGGEAAEGVIFTDGFLASSKDFQTTFFRERYKKLSRKEPSRFAAEAFDLAMIAVEIMKQDDGPSSRGGFVNKLKNIKRFPGVTGEISYDDRVLRKEPKVIIVRNNKFRELRKRN